MQSFASGFHLTWHFLGSSLLFYASEVHSLSNDYILISKTFNVLSGMTYFSFILLVLQFYDLLCPNLCF